MKKALLSIGIIILVLSCILTAVIGIRAVDGLVAWGWIAIPAVTALFGSAMTISSQYLAEE